MNLTKKQAYLAMYNMIDKYYEKTELDDLGAMLGTFDTELFDGDMPADNAVCKDWNRCVIRITSSEYLTQDEAFNAMIEMLKLYNETFGFDIAELIDDLVGDESDNDKIREKWEINAANVIRNQ